MEIERIRHDWPEAAEFTISRPRGYPIYTFIHFQTPVELTLDGQTVRTRPGACIFFSPEVPQYFYAPVPLIHNWIHMEGSIKEDLCRYGIPENTVLYPAETDFISKLFQKIEAEHFSDNPHKKTILESYWHIFLITLSRSLQGIAPAATVRENEKLKMRAVRKNILSQPEQQWTVSQMAAMVAMSESRFHVTYKAYFGSTPMQDVIEARLRQAMTLLSTRPELSVAQIAQMLGYTNEYHFIRLFKTATGTPPGTWRKHN